MKKTLIMLGMVGVMVICVYASGHAQTTTTSIGLTWTAVGDDSLIGTATQYDLRYSTSLITSANFTAATRWTSMPTPQAPGTLQSVTVTGLTPATMYYFAIKTVDDAGNWSGISNVASKATLTPDATRPAPIAVTLSAITDSTVKMSWTAVGDDSLSGTVTSYDIRYATSPITTTTWATATQVSNEPTPAVAGTAQSYTVTGLSRQVTYYFAIKATDDVGNISALSNVPSATTIDSMPPAAINSLTAN